MHANNRIEPKEDRPRLVDSIIVQLHLSVKWLLNQVSQELATDMIEQEALIRAVAFFFVLGVMAVWERRRPCRVWTTAITKRWLDNIGIAALNTVVLRMLFPGAAVTIALFTQHNSWGLLNTIDVATPLKFVIALIALDFTIYCQHVLFHALPVLWRLHMVHHTDIDFDVTTGFRFHPAEIILSMLIKFAVIAALGPAPLAVIVFEILLNATAMFNHSNIRLPQRIDSLLRLLLVTPDMHRVHHSVIKNETNSNFGFNLPWWDRVFGTYHPQPQESHATMSIGLLAYRDPGKLHLPALLTLPFRAQIGDYVITRRGNI